MLNFVETKEILHSESPFIQHVQNFAGKRLCQTTSLKLQKNYIEPVERVIGFDHESDKPDSSMYQF